MNPPPVAAERLPLRWLDESSLPEVLSLPRGEPQRVVGPANFAGQQRVASTSPPKFAAYRVANGVVSASSSSIRTRDFIYIERCEGAESARCDHASDQVVAPGQRWAYAADRPTHQVPQGIALVGSGSANYYHWTLEVLPRLALLDRLGADYADFPLLVGADVLRTRSMREAITALAPERRLVCLASGESYGVEDLIYISSPIRSPFNLVEGESARITDLEIHPEAIQFLRETVRGLATPSHHCGRRLFLARNLERRSYNQREIFGRLAAHGFEWVDFGSMGLAEQIALIRSAEFVTGPSGASWTNILFSEPGTRALCWMAREAGDFPGFPTLAYYAGVDLRCFRYQAFVTDLADLYFKGYCLSVDEVEAAVVDLLRGTDPKRTGT